LLRLIFISDHVKNFSHEFFGDPHPTADSSGKRNRWQRGEVVIWSGIVETFPRENILIISVSYHFYFVKICTLTRMALT
jgi:hypothetical protein